MIKPFSKETAIQIAAAAHQIVEQAEGPQADAGRTIDYTVHALLLLVDTGTRLQTPKERAESFRHIARAVGKIAETDYIPYPGDKL